ncbi:KIN14B-interacting protein At4g14310 [Medicago truncatula]|uniref:Transducin/WD40 domain-like protein, putative n=2 Tax=Medicago truncatula TaxID=3880 RepID=A0A072VSI4_MEDTR|nr:KIN14B-interacting protein At4g14310 [Medicago truncatula]KEH41095.1 transducin/WD40 domain-like protein, putative [Medicago truncatula]
MSTRRSGAAVIDGATTKPTTTTRSITPLTTSRKLPSLNTSSSSSLKENNNPRRSTSRGPIHPTQKPLTRSIPRTDRRSSSSFSSLPRGRSPSPSDLNQTRRVSVDRKDSKSIINPIRKSTERPKSAEKVRTLSNSARVRVRVEENSNSNSNGNSDGSSSNKYQSKLHEKLAFLEGKVKRIASDIKKTKEMLDLNNPDESKFILSDIQDKISGIEKAMVRVVVSEDDNHKVGVVSVNGVEDSKQIKPMNASGLVKGLNSDELEDRLFPHHKLIRDRIMIKDSTVKEKVEIEENVLKSVDENSIALEFLATLGEGSGKVSNHGDPCDGIERGKSGSCSNQKCDIDMVLEADEKLEEFDDQGKENNNNTQEEEGFIADETDEAFNFKLNGIGNKIAAAGWFVSEGEAVLLAHDDATCSYYDIANSEEKSVYIPPPGASPSIWRDCWLIRAQGSDGCSGRYVVAASAGNTIESGFCSWDFYTKEVKAFQFDNGTASSRTALRPLPNNIRRNSTSSTLLSADARQWWYKPCGPLIISTCSSQRGMKVFDVRDGEQVMSWEVQKPVVAMEYSSPLQWRNRGKVVVAEAESITLWDVNSLSPQALVSVPFGGKKISALHVSNTDAELGGGVRKRVSSSEAEGNDGVFCTTDSINILDFRQPSGVGLKIPKHGGVNVQSIFSRGDSVFFGCTASTTMGKRQSSSLIQQFSLRKQELFNTYTFPESNAHSHYAAVSQVWGNSDFVMGVCGLGLYVFDAMKDDDASRVLNMNYDNNNNNNNNGQNLREVVGPDDLYWPSFDYMGSRSLLISRDRPAMWRHLIV